MANPIRCPRCGTELTADSPDKLCPRCMLMAGLDSKEKELSPATAAYSPGFTPPTPEELGHYFPQLEILELLGRGGMGAVYKARQHGLDRLVALKILPPGVGPRSGLRRALHARGPGAGASSIIRTSSASTTSARPTGCIYFVMEYVDGVNLRQAIRARPLTPEQALAIVPQICDALQFAHDEGDRPSRHQAGEHPARQAGPGEDRRLRPGQAARARACRRRG